MSEVKEVSRIYRMSNVYEEALKRINWIFDEFDDVVVSFSGGKDSVIVYQLALQVARERNRLPLNVLFIDQEAEFKATIDIVEKVMANPNVKPYWYQMPIKIFNATSTLEPWIYSWDKENKDKWMREKHHLSIKENTFGTDRFSDLFTNIIKKEFGNKTANIGGVRTEESPTRYLALTGATVYKGETWGKRLDVKNDKYTFYPIYDWSYSDVWKAIFENKWDYCTIYDAQYSYGIPIQKMRVSSLCHETAVGSLAYLQEVEKDTWEKLTARLGGIDTEGKFQKELSVPKELPYMFISWKQYRDFILEKLITSEEALTKFGKIFKKNDITYQSQDDYFKTCCVAILKNDYHSTIMKNYFIGNAWKIKQEKK